MFDNFVKFCLTHGATLYPLEIPSEVVNHEGIANPSIFVDDDNSISMILRNVNYALWNSDSEFKFNSYLGPLYYITPEDDNHLRTKNFLCKFDGGRIEYKLIDTSRCDWEPQWEFVGQEDMRLVRWDGKLYGTGVQRDWNTTGVGRMHLSELDENTGEELSRIRIAVPDNPKSYCEKNWMPILDMPFHYVKWCYPTEVVKVDPITGDCEFILKNETYNENLEFSNTDDMSIRGSSQVIPWGDYRIALVHMCKLHINEKQQKCGTGYYEQFIVWDKDWNIVKMSEPFNFNKFGIEFTNGMAYKDGKFYIPFCLQDNISYMVVVGEEVIRKYIFDKDYSFGPYSISGDNLYLRFFNESCDSANCFDMGRYLYSKGYFAGAMVCFNRAAEYNTFSNIDRLYMSVYMSGLSISKMTHRDETELSMWYRLIDIDPSRSEGYLMLSRYYNSRGKGYSAYTYAKLGYEKNNYRFVGEYSDIDNHNDGLVDYITTLYNTENYKECEDLIDAAMTENKLIGKQYDRCAALKSHIANTKNNRYRVLE